MFKKTKRQKVELLKKDKEAMWMIIKNHPCKGYRDKIMKQYDDLISALQGDKKQ